MRILHLSVAMVAVMFLTLVGACRRDAGPILSGNAALDEGVRRLQQGDIHAAVTLLDRAAADLPNSASAHCNLGIAYWKLSKYSPAARALKKAAALSRQDTRPLEFLARVYMDAEQWGDARKALTEAMTVNANSPEILTALGLAEMHGGDSRQAREWLNRALELKPGYPPALYNMAVLCKDRLKSAAEAEPYLKRYLETAEEGPYMEKAKALMVAVRSAAGQDHAQHPTGRTGAETPPPDSRKAAEACGQGAKCYEAGDMDGAIEAYRRA
jgi:tetratricopeptide (TPR) repeat protein